MGADSVCNVVISSNSRGITTKNFGEVMVLGYQTNDMGITKQYDAASVLPDLITDGYSAYDPIYRACQAAISSSPKIKKVIVGRLVTPFDQTFEIEIESGAVEVDREISFSVLSPAGVETECSYTVQSGDTVTDIAAALAALATAITDLTATSALGVISFEADVSGEMFYITDLDETICSFVETTVDSNLATEYAAIVQSYGDAYGVQLADPNSEARITALAAVVETEDRMLGYSTLDTEAGNPASTDDIMYNLNAAGYNRTFGIYTGDPKSYPSARWMGRIFPINPGKSTWAYKLLSGTIVDDLQSAFTAAIEAKKGNHYTTLKGAAVTRWGSMASGEWIDVIRGRDWLKARLQERYITLQINSPKVPFNQGGAESIGSLVDAQLIEGESDAYGYLDRERGHTVTVPDVTDAAQVSPANKIARTLPNISAEAYLAGAIHIVDPLNISISA